MLGQQEKRKAGAGAGDIGMVSTYEQLNEWMKSQENETLEFKEAKNHFDFEKLTKYCAAIANEGGGKIILGITDKIPRKVVGCKEFNNLIRTT